MSENWSLQDLNDKLKEGNVTIDSPALPIAPVTTGTPTPLPPLKIDMAASLPPFKSETERRAWHHLEQDLTIVKMEYEPLVFHTLAGNYTPDIMTLSDTGKLTFYEVKGGQHWVKHHGSGRSSQKNFWAATALFSWMARFILIYPMPKRAAGGWVRKYWNGRAWREVEG